MISGQKYDKNMSFQLPKLQSSIDEMMKQALTIQCDKMDANYLFTEIEAFSGKSQSQTLQYRGQG